MNNQQPMVKVTISKKIYSDRPSNKQRKYKYTEYHIFHCHKIFELGANSDRKVTMKLYCGNNEYYSCYAISPLSNRDGTISVEKHRGIFQGHPDVYISISPKHYRLESIGIGYIQENK